ncbi:hypothetical protein [Azospirillum humicireducens]|uniref:hypothetical protein n=1 Tax=Azospirillum humicireducens TaxID=1226968 RepID=UPI0011B1CC94|nr:hypothetical protein [Azospirillum humicireducens]
MRRRVLLAAAVVTGWIAALGPVAAQVEAPLPYGTHFIMLIDDSGDMAKYRNRIVADAPSILFGDKRPHGGAEARRFPVFDPTRDVLSVAVYGITETNVRDARCNRDGDPPNPNSFLPEDLFVWIDVREPKTAAMLSQKLAARIGEAVRGPRPDCRLRHDGSPISTASILALTTGKDRVPADSRFSRVVLVNVTNLVSNTNPSAEIAQFARKQGTQNHEQALNLARLVQTNFYLNSPPDWIVTPDERGGLTAGFSDVSDRFHVVFTEAKAVESDPAGLIDVPLRLVLDRVATSPNDVVVVTDDGRTPELVVRGGSRFKAERVSVNGKQISSCRDGCRRQLLDLIDIGEADFKGGSPPSKPPASVRLAAEFRYDTPVYRNLMFPVDERRIEIATKPVLTVQRETVLPWFALPILDGMWEEWFREITLDNRNLAALWREGDGRLTQEDAVKRILQERARIRDQGLAYGGPAGVLFLLFSGSGAWSLYARRRFRPRLTWQSAGTVSIGFDAPGEAPILLGTVEVWNVAPRRPGGHAEEPHRDAAVRAAGWELPGGLVLDGAGGPVIGFAAADATGRLEPEIRQTISHGMVIALFIDPRTILDLEVPAVTGPVDVPVTGMVQLSWSRMQSDRVGTGGLSLEIALTLRLVPESPREPQVGFEPPAMTPEFRGHREGEPPQACLLGSFHFVSNARRRFALPFQDRFTLRVERPEGPLPDDTATLDNSDVTVAAAAAETRRAMLWCDGTHVSNPPASDETYRFMLSGRCAPGSAAGPHLARLRRDSTRCDATLVIVDGAQRIEIAWDRPSDQPFWRRQIGDGGYTPLVPLPGDVLELSGRDVRFDDRRNVVILFDLEIGNSGIDGNGTVDAAIDSRLSGEAVIVSGLGIRSSERPVLQFVNGQPALAAPKVREGQPAERRAIVLDTKPIRSIEGGVLDMGLVSASVTVALEIVDDLGRKTERTLSIVVPLRLELQPSPNWLCIDFGTSAISVAHGRGDQVNVLQLQHIRQGSGDASPSNPCLADFDRANVERNSRSLLPSFILCDADRRRDPVPDRQLRPGFPRFGPASLKPGDPSFISLPAPMESLRSSPGRVIYSLKSWVGLAVPRVPLKDKVSFLRDGHETMERDLPLDELVQSGFAALAEAYILPDEVRPGQIVITHPNTFTALHQGRLHRNAFAALAKRFDIPRRDRIRLLSESDAVAYHYCLQRRSRGDRPTGREHILVYDLGAGTLDLSVIAIDWADDRIAYPQRWRTLFRLGVPVAGNHLDGVLARLVDTSIRDLLSADSSMFEYRFPLVAKAPVRNREAEHTSASHSLWLAVREAKQGGSGGRGWNGTEPLRIAVAAPTLPDPWPLMLRQDSIEARQNVRDRLSGEQPMDRISLSYQVGSGAGESDRIELVLPAGSVHDYGPLREYVRFVTGDVIREALDGSGLAPDKVDTVLISGRGALWPGLADAVRRHFPATTSIPDLNDAESGTSMKEAVVRGAIAWQGMRAPAEPPPPPRLAVMLMPHKDIVNLEQGKTVSIDLGDNQYFRLVQVALKAPRPREDLATLRQHFYIDLASSEYRVDTYWAEDRTLVVTTDETSDGALIIRIGNRTRSYFELRADGEAASDAVRPPWPIGDAVLPPIKE